MSDLARTALAIERDLLDQFDQWMAGHGYTNRSEAVRDLIRTALVESEWADPNADVVGALSIVFDHSQRDLAQGLTQLQHKDHHAILCSQHVHLDRNRCVETILMRGTVSQLRRLADTITTQRGVKFGKLALMSHNL